MRHTDGEAAPAGHVEVDDGAYNDVNPYSEMDSMEPTYDEAGSGMLCSRFVPKFLMTVGQQCPVIFVNQIRRALLSCSSGCLSAVGSSERDIRTTQYWMFPDEWRTLFFRFF